MRRIYSFDHWVLSLLCLCVLGCQGERTSRPSVLVVAVESLGFESIPCESGSKPTVLASLCAESVRFTHAYTPSLMSQATLASLLTGLYPSTHGVRHNGPQFLSAQFDTSAEFAVRQGYRTSFFSGGPPVWRKSGLSQGFEVFDDNIRVDRGQPYRSASQNVGLFLSWLDRTVDDDSFFSFLFLADLQFPDVVTRHEDEERGRGYEGQLEEILESVEHLTEELKNRRRWDPTYFILVGLNGHLARPRPGILETTGLTSDNTQVTLLIKPARHRRDLGIEWKIDKNVSLADVGRTLYQILGGEAPKRDEPPLETVSLAGAVARPEVDWDEDRWIVSETGFPNWRRWGPIQWALRRSQFLVLRQDRNRVFNSLTDRLEMLPLGRESAVVRGLLEPLRHEEWAFTSVPPTVLPVLMAVKSRLAQEVLVDREDPRLVLQNLSAAAKAYPEDPQLADWAAVYALNKQMWPELETLGEAQGKPTWSHVARRRQGKSDLLAGATGCWAILRPDLREYVRRPACDDELVLAMAAWDRDNDASIRQERENWIVRLFNERRAQQLIGWRNAAQAWSWDVDPSLPNGPSIGELYLALPEAKKLASAVARRLQ